MMGASSSKAVGGVTSTSSPSAPPSGADPSPEGEGSSPSAAEPVPFVGDGAGSAWLFFRVRKLGMRKAEDFRLRLVGESAVGDARADGERDELGREEERRV
jgi:hypothetical protein